ncbi:unnamed protein product [Peronospora farinosa]|uniref:Protein kinase domain-containing protein n=1 Tax=Peronospora farinosa TaxID=134698 RepID=A0ABN8C1G8_9STRA|nr:unnamed protein product [Peronospora farinosa]
MAIDIARVIMYLHSHEVIHRDIKARTYTKKAEGYSFGVLLSELNTCEVPALSTLCFQYKPELRLSVLELVKLLEG